MYFKKQNWNELTEAVEPPSLQILKPWLVMALTNLLWVVLLQAGAWSRDLGKCLPTYVILWL